MSLSLIDILFLVTVVLLVFNGLRNGAVFSLINLLSIPIGLGVAYYYGPSFTALLASNGLSATPLISYAVLFFGVVLILHIVGTFVRGIVRKIPFINFGDALLGAVVGFGEAWLLWLVLLIMLGTFLNGLQSNLTALQQTVSIVPGVHITFDQLKSWHDFYNQAVNHSLFAQVNSIFNQNLRGLPQLPQ
jgi:uncharacterized membrane protein required for colicin V production